MQTKGGPSTIHAEGVWLSLGVNGWGRDMMTAVAAGAATAACRLGTEFDDLLDGHVLIEDRLAGDG